MLRNMYVLVLTLLVLSEGFCSPVEMKKADYLGWPGCVFLSNGEVEVVATTSVGPRIIRYAFAGGGSVLQANDNKGGRGGNAGGHRLWHGPEVMPRTYAPDNEPVSHEWTGGKLLLTQEVEKSTGIQKQIEIELAPDSSHVTVTHRLINHNVWAVELAPWALSVMQSEGRAILPQEPYRPHSGNLLPARTLSLWYYTRMNDPRWTWGEKYIQLQQDPDAKTSQKLGLMNKQGWAAYAWKGLLFLKRFAHDENATYIDYGSNCEVYTGGSMLEIETLGPLTQLDANGGTVEHIEHWSLHKTDVAADEKSIDKTILPLVRQTNNWLENE